MSDNRTLSEWISDEEHRWRALLQPVRLVIETDFSEHDVREAQRKFGAMVGKADRQGIPYLKIIKRHPALTLLTSVGHALLAYDHGAYWESYWDEPGLARNTDFENDIRRNIVDKCSLARFPDIERDSNGKYVMMLALHAGIPIHSVRELLVVINDHITQGRIATGAAVMAALGSGVDWSVADCPTAVRALKMSRDHAPHPWHTPQTATPLRKRRRVLRRVRSNCRTAALT